MLVMADRAYDTNAIRQQIEDQGAVPNIPPKRTRRWKSCFSPVLYRRRNAIERMFCRLKDFRRIATRYDKLAANFLSAIYLVATISYWLGVPTPIEWCNPLGAPLSQMWDRSGDKVLPYGRWRRKPFNRGELESSALDAIEPRRSAQPRMILDGV
jgi:Transposase DDE domain